MAYACAKKPDPQVNIDVQYETPTLNHKLNDQGIYQLRLKGQGTNIPYKDIGKEQYVGSGVTIKPYMAGLTLSATSFSSQVKLTSRKNDQSSNTHNCYDIELTLLINVKDDVYISNSLEKGSCEYTEALRHEYEHVKIHRGLITNNLEYFKSFVTTSINEFLSIVYNNQITRLDTPQLEKQLSIYMTRKLQELLEIYSNAEINEQQKIDTAEEYLKVRKQCTFLDKYRALGALIE